MAATIVILRRPKISDHCLCRWTSPVQYSLRNTVLEPAFQKQNFYHTTAPILIACCRVVRSCPRPKRMSQPITNDWLPAHVYGQNGCRHLSLKACIPCTFRLGRVSTATLFRRPSPITHSHCWQVNTERQCRKSRQTKNIRDGHRDLVATALLMSHSTKDMKQAPKQRF